MTKDYETQQLKYTQNDINTHAMKINGHSSPTLKR